MSTLFFWLIVIGLIIYLIIKVAPIIWYALLALFLSAWLGIDSLIVKFKTKRYVKKHEEQKRMEALRQQGEQPA